MDQPNLNGIDPTLDSCCQREVEGNRSKAALDATLRRHDRIALAERRRRNVLHNLSFGSGCRCCYDPDGDGGEYPALKDARLHLTAGITEEGAVEQEEEEIRKDDALNDGDDSDDDSEFGYLLDEDLPGDDNLQLMQQDRLQELEMAAMMQEAAIQHGFGVHRQMNPARVLAAAGLGMGGSRYGIAAVPPAVVLHLFESDSEISANLDLCLEEMALTKYRGTKFVRGNGRATLLGNQDIVKDVLPSLKIESDLPVLVAIRDGVVTAVSRKLSGLCVVRDGTVEPRAVEEWLNNASVLLREVPLEFEDLCRIRPEESALLENMMREKARIDEIQAEVYECGVPGCHKTFSHEHVGVSNEKQSGLLVSEDETIGADIN